MANGNNKIVDMRGRLGASAVLNELAQVFAEGSRNLGDANAVLQGGIQDFGSDEMVDELCRRLTRLEPDDDSTALVWALEKIGGNAVIEQMLQIARTPHLAPRIRTDAAIVLHALGEPLDLEDLPASEAGNIHAILQKILDDTERQLQQVRVEERAFMLDELFDEIGHFMGRGNSADMLRTLVQALAEQDRPVAADMLWVLREFCPEDAIRDLAGQGLEEMRWRDLKPSPDMVSATHAGRFSQGYVSEMGPQATQTQLLFIWEQSLDQLIFVLLPDRYSPLGRRHQRLFSQAIHRARGIRRNNTDVQSAGNTYGAYQRQERPPTPGPGPAGQHPQCPSNPPGVPPLSPADRPDLVRGEGVGATTVPGKRSPFPSARQGRRRGGVIARHHARSELRRSTNPERTHAVARLLPVPRPAHLQAGGMGRGRGLYHRLDRRPSGPDPAGSGPALWHIRRLRVQARRRDWNGVSRREQGTIAYATDKARSEPFEEAMERMGEMLGEDLRSAKSHQEELEIDFQDYLEEYAELGVGIRRLSRAEFEQLTEELDSLAALEEVEKLTGAQERRLQELLHLLLLD